MSALPGAGAGAGQGPAGSYHNQQPQDQWAVPAGRSEVQAQIREINDMLSLNNCIGARHASLQSSACAPI